MDRHTTFRAAFIRKKWRVVSDHDGTEKIDVTIENASGVNHADREALADLLASLMNQTLMWSRG